MEKGTENTVAGILSEIEKEGVLRPLKSRGMQPKNYSRENVLHIRQVETAVKKLNPGNPEEFGHPKKKNDKYSHIQSKVAEYFKNPLAAPRLESSSRFLRAHSGQTRLKSTTILNTIGKQSLSKKQNQENVDPACSEATKTKVKLPRPESVSRLELEKLNTGPAENVSARSRNPVRRGPSAPTSSNIRFKSEPRHKLGTVPKYLQERKKDLEERTKKEKTEISLEKKEGHVLMQEEERQRMLKLLQQSREALIRQLVSLPVRVDTLKLRNQKESLEKQIVKVEEGLRVFSMPKVYVKPDG